MRLYYLDESAGARYYVRSALGIDAEVWSNTVIQSKGILFPYKESFSKTL